MLTVSAVAALVPSLLLAGGITVAGPQRCAVVDSIGRCLVSAVDPGRPGAGRPSRKPPATTGSRGRPPRSVAGPELPAPPPPRPQRALPVGSGWGLRPVDDLDRLLAEPSEPDGGGGALTPELLARRAVQKLDLPAPGVRTSGDDGAVVGVPLWLWVDREEAFATPVAATAAAGAARVTAEARFTGLEWSMGPPGAVVRCNGSGTPWTGQEGPSPDCGYTYAQRSLVQRTGGTGRWPVTVVAVWSVTWSGFSDGTPVAGEQELRVPASTSLPVGEVQVLVDGDGS